MDTVFLALDTGIYSTHVLASFGMCNAFGCCKILIHFIEMMAVFFTFKDISMPLVGQFFYEFRFNRMGDHN